MRHEVDERRCPLCQESIREEAEICPHCKSALSGRTRKKERFLTGLNSAALIATTLAILFLALSYYQTGKVVQIQNAAITLQAEALERTDSSLGLIKEQISVMRESMQIQRKISEMTGQAFDQNRRKLIEENKPDVRIPKVDCRRDSIGLVLFVNFRNYGEVSASNFTMFVTAKDHSSNKALLRDSVIFSTLPSKETKIIDFMLPQLGESVVEFKLYWGWPDYGISDSLIKYMIFSYDRESNSCSGKTLTDNVVSSRWKQVYGF